MTKDEALRLALEEINRLFDTEKITGATTETIQAIKAALLSRSDGEAKDEPVRDCNRVECMGSNGCIDKCWKPQRTWVGLTDEEQLEIYKQHSMDGWGLFYEAIEAKLKEKNT